MQRIVAFDLIDHGRGNVLVDIGWRGKNPQPYLDAWVIGQLMRRNPTPLKKLPGAFVR
jgi:hypothetical protein